MFDPLTLQCYRSFKDDVAAVSINSTTIGMTGKDRHSFLHNFCTNEIKSMPALGVCEAFILDGKGKTSFHVHVLNGSDTLWLHSVADDADKIIEHLDKYLMRDDVQMATCPDFKGTFIAGPSSESALESVLQSSISKNQIAEVSTELIVAHLELAGWGYLCLGTSIPLELEPLLTASSTEALHAVRIENETPWMGIDIDQSNLPQELLRDEQAINFNKGCYLGQETVARIDAIGRVNRVIAKVQSPQSVSPGDELTLNDKSVGKILSASWSPDQNCFLALAMIRRPHEKPDTELSSASGTVTVV